MLNIRKTLVLPFALAWLAGQTVCSQVVINEIHYDPYDKTSFEEFIELYNAGTGSVDLSGWSLRDAVDYTFPNGTTIPANGYLVVAEDPTTLNSIYAVTSLGPWTGSLNNEGETVELRDAGNNKMDEVDYQLGFPWPTVGDAPGYSIELIHPSLDNDLGGNWRSSQNGNPLDETTLLFPENSIWKYLKGINEASSPTTAWRAIGFDDSGWLSGTAPIGYGEPGHVVTTLSDMNEIYSGVFFRKTFIISDPANTTELILEASCDDGFKLWINQTNVLNFNISSSELPITGTANSQVEDLSYNTYILSNPSAYLVPGTNVVAVQAHNGSLSGSSDFWFDARLFQQTVLPSHGPTPGARNSVYATNAPPQIRKVDHSPNQPSSGEDVLITAKVTDPEGIAEVVLLYQLVDPGDYIALTDTAYGSNWTAMAMSDDGTGGDELAGDSIYTASLPASLQQHRRLVRYRISAKDGLDDSITVPYQDDPQPNFAYFCYNGVPAWQASIEPGSSPSLDFGTNVMRRLPAMHLISNNSDIENATWFDRYTGDLYKWSGTLVYDGKVYDHIHYRARGGFWRYAMVKNMWKFDFNRGHDFQMRDDYGKKYDTKWTKLNLGACIQQGDAGHRGEQGMFESVGSRLFNLAGVPSFNTSFLQLRIIDDADEATTNQYEGDFWGLYLAVEQQNGRFLDEHGLPDGNFYKMEGGNWSGELSNLGPLGPDDKSDLFYMRDNSDATSELWWETNWNLDSYYSYQTIVGAIHHYDIPYGKNYFYYHNPESGKWQVIPWDLDLTWADNMYERTRGGMNELAAQILYAASSGGDYSVLTLPGNTRTLIRTAFRNRIREIRDLLFNAEQAGQLIDEKARLLRDKSQSPSFLDADRAMWDYNPKMDSSTYFYPSFSDKALTGRFYQWPFAPGASNSFEGCVQIMKSYVDERGTILDTLSYDAAIPDTPEITYAGAGGYPVNGLAFQCSSFSDPQDSFTFAAMEWRIGEVLDEAAPAYDPSKEPPFEIETKWESGELNSFNNNISIPPDVLKIGHAYRARVRMKDTSNRWSHWSAPVNFIVAESSAAGAMSSHLRISELMYDPPDGSDYEFVELRNTSATENLFVEGAAFTSGIDFNFPTGSFIEPGGYLLIIGTTNTADFRLHYGLSSSVPIAGAFSGSLSNKGEELVLKTAPGGIAVASFAYSSSRLWPLAAAEAGHSLVPMTETGGATGALDYLGNWRASAYIGGSPGSVDPAPPPAGLVLSEIAAHTDYANAAHPEYDSNDWIELHNTSASPIDLTDWYLSDETDDPDKWPCPPISIPAGGFLVFNEVDDFHSPISSGFGLDKAGEQVLLSYLPGNASNRVVDAVGFKGQENERSLNHRGQYWDVAGRTEGNANSAPIEDLRISEIMYWPEPDGTNDNVRDEFIEIYNPTDSSILMQSEGEPWRIDGGVEYTFPNNTPVPAGSTLLVVGFNPVDTATLNAFKAAYGLTNSVAVFGPWSGKLGNRSERVALERSQLPDFVGDDYSWVVVDETVYGNQTPWSTAAAGGGSSLSRVAFNQSGLDPDSWNATAPNPGTTGPSPLADSDGDGMSDFDEWLCGTNPNDRNSVFRVEPDTGPNFIWTSISGRTYTVHWTDNLMDPFVPIAIDLLYPQSNYTDNAHSTNSANFYRIEVNLE